MSLFGPKDEEIRPLTEFLFNEKEDLNNPTPPISLGHTTLNRIAALTYNDKICDKIMAVLEKAITPTSYPWLVLYKALLTLHTIVQYGSDRAVNKCAELYRFVMPLQEYNSAMVKRGIFGSTGGRDFGLPVRSEAKVLCSILKNDEAIQSFRVKANDGLDTLVPIGTTGNSGNDLLMGSIAAPTANYGDSGSGYRSSWPSTNNSNTSNNNNTSSGTANFLDDFDLLSPPVASSTSTLTSLSTSSSNRTTNADVLDLFDQPFNPVPAPTYNSYNNTNTNNSFNNSINNNMYSSNSGSMHVDMRLNTAINNSNNNAPLLDIFEATPSSRLRNPYLDSAPVASSFNMNAISHSSGGASIDPFDAISMDSNSMANQQYQTQVPAYPYSQSTFGAPPAPPSVMNNSNNSMFVQPQQNYGGSFGNHSYPAQSVPDQQASFGSMGSPQTFYSPNPNPYPSPNLNNGVVDDSDDIPIYAPPKPPPLPAYPPPF